MLDIVLLTLGVTHVFYTTASAATANDNEHYVVIHCVRYYGQLGQRQDSKRKTAV